MRKAIFTLSIIPAILLSGCGPQEQVRTSEFYANPENAAEFAKALEACKKAGFSNKDKCASVWQAKLSKEMAEDRAFFERVAAEQEGVTVVMQSPKAAAAAAPVSVRNPANATTAAAEPLPSSALQRRN